MSYVLIAVGALVAALGALLYKKQYSKRPGDPPLIAGIPYLGVAPQLSSNPDAFMKQCKEKYGDIFTLYMMGQKMNFVADVHSFPVVYKNSKVLKFDGAKVEIGYKAFGVDPARHHDSIPVLEFSMSYLLNSAPLEALSHRFAEKLIFELKNRKPKDEVKFFEFMSRLLFWTSADALFGDGFSNEEVYKAYDELDKEFAILASPLPEFLLKNVFKLKGYKSRQVIAERIVKQDYPNRSALIDARAKAFAEGLEDIRGTLETSILWGSQVNTRAAAFWLMIYLLADKEALRAIKAEIEEHLTGVDPTEYTKHFGTMPLLDSAFYETLRMISSNASLRIAVDDGELKLTSGQVFQYKKGDFINLVSWLVHNDPEIYPEPEKFKYDRFMPGAKFYKNGKEVTKNMMAFGGGVSLCPGRNFAKNEVKTLAVTLLVNFNMHLKDPIPPFDFSRVMLGNYHPTKDVTVTFAAKQ